MKKVLSVVLALCLTLTCLVSAMLAGAEEAAPIEPAMENNTFYYEADQGVVSANAGIFDGDWYGEKPGATENRFVGLYGGSVSMRIQVPRSGYYTVGVSGSTYNANDDANAKVFVNNDPTEYYFAASHEKYCQWPVVGISTYNYDTASFVAKDAFWLEAGKNNITVQYNDYSGWILIDRLVLTFQPAAESESLSYEANQGVLTQGAGIAYGDWYGGRPGATENIFVCLSGAGGSIRMNVDIPQAGYYTIGVSGSTYNANDDANAKVSVNDDPTEYYFAAKHEAYCQWPVNGVSTYNYETSEFVPADAFWLEAGQNTVTVRYNEYSGWILIDRLVITADTTEDQNKANAVMNLIHALPETVTEAARAQILQAKAAYDLLTDAQKSLVTNADVLNAKLGLLDDLPQQPVKNGKELIYEAESCSFSPSHTVIETEIPDYSGTGYVYNMNGSFQMKLHVPEAGQYALYVASANNDNHAKCDYVYVNDGTHYLIATPADPANTWCLSQPGTEHWENNQLKPTPVEGGFTFRAGTNIVTFTAYWGYAAYDRIVLVPIEQTEPEDDSEVNRVIQLIAALPARVTESDRGQVEQAKAAYVALPVYQAARVTNAEVLWAKYNVLNTRVLEPVTEGSKLIYEVDECGFQGEGAYYDNTIPGYTGNGYVFNMNTAFRVRFRVPTAGQYTLYVASANNDGSAKCDYISVNDGTPYFVATPASPSNTWILSQPGTEHWENGQLKPAPVEGGFSFRAGTNTIEIAANWGYAAYDRFVLIPVGVQEVANESLVEKLNEQIQKLPDIVALKDIQDVETAYHCYLSLSQDDKAFVKNAEKLLRLQAMVNALRLNNRAVSGTMLYECEAGILKGNSSIVTEKSTFPSYSGNGYVFLFDQSFDVEVYVPQSGYYHIQMISGATETANKCDYVQINGGEKYLIATNGRKGVWQKAEFGTENWADGKLQPLAESKGYYLKAGKNTITVSANWGYCAYDAIEILPEGVLPQTGDTGRDIFSIMVVMMASSVLFVILFKKLRAQIA